MSEVRDPRGVACAFVNARRQDDILTSYPGEMPSSLHDAYEIQDAAIAQWGGQIGGWKLGRVPADQVGLYGAERLAGPIFVGSIALPLDDSLAAVPVLRGFAAVEAELLLRIARPVRRAVSLEEAADLVGEVRLGIEVASSPFPAINSNGAAVTASDFGNNHGLVVGPLIGDGWSDDFLAVSMSLAIDGVCAGQGRPADMLDGPLGSLAFLSQVLEVRGMPIEAGSWISTGAITGVHPVKAGSVVTARFGGELSLSCRTTGMFDQHHARGRT